MRRARGASSAQSLDQTRAARLICVAFAFNYKINWFNSVFILIASKINDIKVQQKPKTTHVLKTVNATFELKND